MKPRFWVLLLLPLTLGAQNGERVFDYGFEQRVRNENWNNIFDWNDTLDDQRVQVRYRTRLWFKGPLSTNVDFHAGLNQETCQIVTPGTPFKFDEVIFETAYLDFKKLFVQGLSLRVGRQNLVKGEGFLFLEGTPYDGSRTIYSNAAVLAYAFHKSKIEAIGIFNPRTDRFLPRIHNRSRQLIEWDDRAAGLYYTGNQNRRTALETYWFLKKESGDRRAATHPQYQPGLHVHTAGARVVRRLGGRWSVTGELARQWGGRDDGKTIAGLGGYGYLKRSFGGRKQHAASIGYYGMSGDDPATRGRVEGWNPLFSRWPKWSEMLIYSQFREVGAAYWTNTGMWFAEAVVSPWKPVNARFTYYRMHAGHPFPGDPRTFGAGARRGDMPQVRVDIRVNPSWSGHVLYEHMAPGSFYSRRSHAYFLRFEAIYAWQGKIAAHR